MIYYAETELGCGLGVARTIKQAERLVRQEIGTYHEVYVVRKATKDDINWVKGMGGWIPEGVQT